MRKRRNKKGMTAWKAREAAGSKDPAAAATPTAIGDATIVETTSAPRSGTFRGGLHWEPR